MTLPCSCCGGEEESIASEKELMNTAEGEPSFIYGEVPGPPTPQSRLRSDVDDAVCVQHARKKVKKKKERI